MSIHDDINDEIKEIAQKALPKSIEVSNLPTVQKVEVINQKTAPIEVKIPPIPAPQVTVNPPDIVIPPFPEIPAPQVTIDLDKLETSIAGLSEILQEIRTETIQNRPLPQTSGYRGGAIGPSSVSSKNSKGRVINPSTAVSDEEILSTSDPQGTVIVGKRDVNLGRQIAEYIGVGGIKTDALKVLDENNHLLKEILLELKANNSHQEILTETTFDGTE